ncbi:hypothetical protein [Rickettsia endosymbiont of Polydrusus tereticollis]
MTYSTFLEPDKLLNKAYETLFYCYNYGNFSGCGSRFIRPEFP